jgi:uncharacterized protein (UPF0332 family)
VKRGRLSMDCGRQLQRLFDARVEGDYRDLIIVQESQAKSSLDLADEFVREVAVFLTQELTEPGG